MEYDIPFLHDDISSEPSETERTESNSLQTRPGIFIPNNLNNKETSHSIHIQDSSPANHPIFLPEILNNFSVAPQPSLSPKIGSMGERNETSELPNSNALGQLDFLPEPNIIDTGTTQTSHGLNGYYVEDLSIDHTPPAGRDTIQNDLVQIQDFSKLILPTHNTEVRSTYHTDVLPTFHIEVLPKNDTDVLSTYNTTVLHTYDKEVLPTYNTDILPTFHTEVLPTYNTDILPTFHTEVLPTYNTEVLSTYHTEVLPSYDTEVLPTYHTNWDLDPNFLDENERSKIRPHNHIITSTPFGFIDTNHSHPVDENHLFNGDSNSISSGTSGKKIKHQIKWELFDEDDDEVEVKNRNMIQIPNGDIHHVAFQDNTISTNPEIDSKHEPKTNPHGHKKKKHKKKPKHYSKNLETSQLSNSQNLPDASKSRHRHKTDFGTAEIGNLDGALDHQHVIKTKHLKYQSDRSSVPMFYENEYDVQHLWNQNSTVLDTRIQTKEPIGKLFGIESEPQDHYSFYQPILNRPHSVASSVFLNDLIFNNIQEDQFVDNPTAEEKRLQFRNNYRSTKWSSLPEESNMERFLKDTSSPKAKQESKMIFKTPSSASLLSDSSLNDSPPIVSSRSSQSKISKWKSIFSDKRKASQYMPLDDSMNFGTQPSSISADTTDNNNFEKEDNVDSNDDEESKKDSIADKEDDTDKAKQDAKPETRTAVYKRRWYLLFLFSVSALLWNAVWSTWGPIAQSAKLVYEWTDGDIAMFVWLGNIPFLITMLPMSYLMDVIGMRMSMIVACTFMFFGAGFRCIPSDVTVASWLIRIGQFLNGMAGTIPNSGPALLSALWFPPNQRASATAISTVAGYMGASVSFVIGPLLVPEPNDLAPVNDTDDALTSGAKYLDTDNSTGNSTSYDEQKQGIMTILYAEFGISALLLFLVLVYFPSKPPLPPSISASIPREKYIAGLKMLIRNKQFWVVALAFSVPVGVYESWQVILDVNLSAQHISQETAGWLDFYATVGGCVSGLLICKFVDFFTRQMKLFLLVFYTLAAVSILWFTLVVFDILPFDAVSIYAAIIIAGVFIDGAGPLFFELSIEVSYPVGEGVASGFIQMLCAAAGIVFLSVVQVESLGTAWMNWCFLGTVATAIPLLFFIKTTYGRADIDDMELDVSDDEEGTTTIEATDSNEKTYLFGSSHF